MTSSWKSFISIRPARYWKSPNRLFCDLLIQINSLHLLHLIQKGNMPVEIHLLGSWPLAGMLSVKY